MFSRSEGNRKRYYQLKVVAVITGVVVPALVGLNLSGAGGVVVEIFTLVLSVFSGIAVGLLDAVAIRQRYRLNRSYYTPVYREGVLFATRTGKYSNFGSHTEGMNAFVESVESYLEQFNAGYQEEILRPDSTSRSSGAQDESTTSLSRGST